MIESWLEMAGGTSIRESGDDLVCKCPFHEDGHRSFAISKRTGKYICYSASCGEQGNLVSFLTRACGFPFDRARSLAAEYDNQEELAKGWAELPAWEDRRKVVAEEEDKTPPPPERMVGAYAVCPKYMLDRGFDKAELREWEVGFDRDTSMVVLPVRSKVGKLLGFTKRSTTDAKGGYLHLGFRKSQHLYGAHLLTDPKRPVWVHEGSFDAIAARQLWGVQAVSTMGARVSKRQAEAVAEFREPVLALDGDKDGRSAARKIGDVCLEMGKDPWVADEYSGRKDAADLLKASSKVKKKFFTELKKYSIWRIGVTESGELC